MISRPFAGNRQLNSLARLTTTVQSPPLSQGDPPRPNRPVRTFAREKPSPSDIPVLCKLPKHRPGPSFVLEFNSSGFCKVDQQPRRPRVTAQGLSALNLKNTETVEVHLNPTFYDCPRLVCLIFRRQYDLMRTWFKKLLCPF